MRRYLLHVGYCGTRHRGTQRQTPEAEEVQGSIHGLVEKGLRCMFPDSHGSLTFSSRTDKGVHAVCNTAHVDLCKKSGVYEPDLVTKRLNTFFKKSEADIRVHRTVIVPPDFHARYRATARTYLYRLAVTPHQTNYRFDLERFLPAAEFNKLYLVSPPFEVERVAAFCGLLEGTHDFASFGSATSKSNYPVNTTRTINEIRVTPGRALLDPRHDPLYSRLQLWDVTITAHSFIYKQVRRTVGVLVSVAQGRLGEQEVRHLLDHPAHSNWPHGIQLAPPSGLFLLNVHYDPRSLVVGSQYEDLADNFEGSAEVSGKCFGSSEGSAGKTKECHVDREEGVSNVDRFKTTEKRLKSSEGVLESSNNTPETSVKD